MHPDDTRSAGLVIMVDMTILSAIIAGGALGIGTGLAIGFLRRRRERRAGEPLDD